MKKASLRSVALGVILGVSGVVSANNATDEETLKSIAGYRQWTRVTAKALPVIDSSIAG